MNVSIWRWRLHRATVDRAHFLWPFSRKRGRKRLLMISCRDPICHAQLFPFFFHQSDLAARDHIELRELPLDRFESDRHPYGGGAAVDAVCFQTWFSLGPQAMEALARKIRTVWPTARVAYFDWFAPTDLRYAEALGDHIDVYLKKQTLSDFAEYGRATRGDTNLTDYYSRRFHLDHPETHFRVPDRFRDKLVLGTHFAFSDYMLPRFLSAYPAAAHRPVDLHARIAVKGSDWYERMRQESLDKVNRRANDLKVISQGRVSRKEFFTELYGSKICFSPFGYGEICWRDFEAMFTGSLLLKPDVSHLDCYPNVFVPHETYVPLGWDLSDFDEKIDHYLKHPAEREAITRRAFAALHDYFRERRFLDDVRPLLSRLNLIPARPQVVTSGAPR
ncbi:glycosyltransferase [Frigoriglobus tundricola]|uniref:Spore protein YkvP/CgeB glycosyl transferase-like domain-containing protein n=1 Tax=Frigoriglobus tundricola TaxID=2774151 RepID=A0A6M5Z2D8_9BACT|nr:glycosyltransferase [Frigoriglobus tundricola]QJW99683.1 hypothetical protein FTUN_7304 [Frigoriglobus tundricola]